MRGSREAARRQVRVVMIGTSPLGQGGVSTVARNLVQSDVFRKIQWEYVVSHEGGGRLRKIAVALRAAREVWRLARGSKGLLVAHVHMASRASFWRKAILIEILRSYQVPYILQMHGGEFHLFLEKECGARQRSYVRRVLRGATKVVALGPTWEGFYRRVVGGDKVLMIPNPVVIPNECDQKVDPVEVVFLGRIEEAKGIWDLLEAFGRLGREGVAFRAVLGGTGRLRAARAAVRELGLGDRIEVPGWLDPKQRDGLLRRASIVVLPSYNEGLPLGILEGMAHGAAVVGSSVGDIPWVLEDGKAGVLISAGDVEALTRALGLLLQDRERRQALAKRGRARVKALCEREMIAERWLELYRAALQP